MSNEDIYARQNVCYLPLDRAFIMAPAWTRHFWTHEQPAMSQNPCGQVDEYGWSMPRVRTARHGGDQEATRVARTLLFIELCCDHENSCKFRTTLFVFSSSTVSLNKTLVSRLVNSSWEVRRLETTLPSSRICMRIRVTYLQDHDLENGLNCV